MKIILFLILFLVVCSLVIINNHDLKLSNKEDVQKFSELYSEWFDNFYLNLRNVTGYVVDMSWVPE